LVACTMSATIVTTLFFMIVLVLCLEVFNSWSNWKLLKPKPINVSPFQQFMVKSVDDYRIEAQKNLGPKHISENMIFKYSFQQVVKDLLNEFELNYTKTVSSKESELKSKLKSQAAANELNYSKLMWSNELELNYTKTIASEMNKQLESFYLSKLSYVIQRYVIDFKFLTNCQTYSTYIYIVLTLTILFGIFCRVIIEKLFTEFISYYKYDANFTAFIDNSGLEKDLLNNLKSSDPKMNKINLVMNKILIQSHYFKMKNYPSNTTLPSYASNNIMYGSLSEVVHNPDLQSIVILSDISDEWKLTYKNLGEHFQFKVIVVDALMAAAGKGIASII